ADPRGNEITDTIWDEPSIGIIGLEAGTNYMVRVRTYCGDDNYSAYVSTNFRTTGGVGIDDVNTVSCTIYPNPTTSSTTISVSGVNGKVKIEVVDMNGRVVSSDNLECSSDCVKTMDVDRLAQGAYFVRITGESVNMVRKLIVR
ncbi:MAG: T9SS type A sorting domain-containing protein, partial [Bacteroidales bacterium]|nr:T9SS type A sorting domain-containing protein [Bacteroidales bacterium]